MQVKVNQHTVEYIIDGNRNDAFEALMAVFAHEKVTFHRGGFGASSSKAGASQIVTVPLCDYSKATVAIKQWRRAIGYLQETGSRPLEEQPAINARNIPV